MRSIGIDLGKVNSQVSVRDEQGEEIQNVRVPTSRAALRVMFPKKDKVRILIEACTLARWVFYLLTALGHDVVIADPNFLPMYVDHASKRKKTDKRDASLLSLALFKGNWRPAHLRSEEKQVRKSSVDVRSRLVRSRTKHINGVRSQLLQWGCKITGGEPEAFPDKAKPEIQVLPEELRPAVEGEPQIVQNLNKIIVKLEKRVTREAKSDPDVARLMTMPVVGARRGKRVAVVALARKIAGILWAMWKNQEKYDPYWADRRKVVAA